MKVSPYQKLCSILKTAEPLPILALGYLIGLLTATGAYSANIPTWSIVALPFRSACTAAVSCEFPLFFATLFCGLTRFPMLAQLPVFCRSLLWGYGSLRIYSCYGAGLPYFRYVTVSGASLFSLCCLARLASDFAHKASDPTHQQLFDYFRRSLFYWGLILLTIPLRF